MTGKITKEEKRKYVLSTKVDYEILGKIKQLEKIKLEKHEMQMVKFLKTQLEKNWRKPILNLLNKFLSKRIKYYYSTKSTS